MKWTLLLVAFFIAGVKTEVQDEQPEELSNVHDHLAGKLGDYVKQIENPAIVKDKEEIPKNNVDGSGYVEIKDIGYYKVQEDKTTWSMAMGFCIIEEAHLAVINNNQEADALKKLMQVHNIPYYVHIGFSDLMKRGHFVTLEGKPIDHEGYTRWEGGIPSSNFRCGAMTPAGELTNRDCDEELSFICEKDITSTWIYKRELKSTYFLNREEMFWSEALQMCHGYGATLAVVNSEEEADFLSTFFTKDLKLIHVGVHDKYSEEFYVTVDGVKIDQSGYNKWVPFQPLKEYHLNTVALNNRSLYALMPESARLPFICEKHL